MLPDCAQAGDQKRNDLGIAGAFRQVQTTVTRGQNCLVQGSHPKGQAIRVRARFLLPVLIAAGCAWGIWQHADERKPLPDRQAGLASGTSLSIRGAGTNAIYASFFPFWIEDKVLAQCLVTNVLRGFTNRWPFTPDRNAVFFQPNCTNVYLRVLAHGHTNDLLLYTE